MSFTITQPGEYVDANGLPVRVTHIDGEWAVGFYSDGTGGAWECENGYSPFATDIKGPKPAEPELPDPGEGWRLLEDHEVLQEGDERQDGCDSPPRRWLGPLRDTTLIGKTVSAANMSVFSLRILGWRRRIPKPEPWVATNELRYREVPFGTLGAVILSVSDDSKQWSWKRCAHEQKWTCGDKYEWRPIPVEVQP